MDAYYKVNHRLTGTSVKSITSALFLICMNCSFVLQMSQLSNYTIIHIFNIGLTILGIAFLFIHFLTRATITLKWFLGTILLIIIGLVTYYKSGSPTILKLILFFYAVQNVYRKTILKYFMFSLIIPELIVILSSFLGITNIRYTGLKSALCFGMINPNTVPVIIFAIIVAYNLRHEDNLKFSDIVIEGIITWLTFYFCRARTAGLVLVAYYLMLIVIMWWGDKKLVGVFLWLLKFFFPVSAVITIYLAIAFRSYTAFWLTVNNITSGRLLAWSRYLKMYGVSVLGNNIELNLGSLDNAYMQLLIKYGIIAFVTYAIMFYITSNFAYKNHKRILLVSIIATEAYCIAEFGPLLINFCPVLVYLACLLSNERGTMITS